ncbi:arabinofuranosidase catalytic domain-containing protein [Microbispora rosea]|uniref:arabinofuranosidase catalytic domain-containing protein n=1 Tax=Microbispora rosea TaxID=58117 RepID=UPI003442AD7E
MKVPRLRPWLAIGLVAVAGAVGALTAPAAHAATGCRVDYSVTNQWPGGFGANVSIDNLGDPVNGWKLTWSFSAGQTITQLWSGTYTQSGSQVTVTNVSYNGAIPSGGSTSFGFNGAFNGSNPVPSSFALNGVTCTGGVTGSPSPSPSASPSANASPSPSASPSTTPVASKPCDIYASGGTPCVAAHSTTRALFRSYSGNLYQVRRSSDNATRNIGVLTAGGSADAGAQDSFCAGTTCVITVVYDQSGRGNDLWYQGSSVVPGSTQSKPAIATTESLSVGGNKAYSLYINPGNSYWRDGHLTGVPTGTAPEGMYMVTSGTHVNSGCCFDYGNSETTRKADAAGAMDAIYFGTSCWFGGCSGSGPWVQADLEWGLYPGGSSSWNPNQRAFTSKFVTATLKNNGTSRFAIKGSNAQSGSLYTLYDGGLPSGYSPMKKQGAIVLGSGGDCCKPGGGANLSAGTFYEGAMVSGYPSDATENAVQADIVAAGYR